MIEEYYWDLVFKRDELEAMWKQEPLDSTAKKLTKVKQALQGRELIEGESGDEWFDDWDGAEDEDEPEPDPADDWADVIRG